MADLQIHQFPTVSNPTYILASNGSTTGKILLASGLGTMVAGALVVAPSGYLGHADIVCTGTNDEVTISGALSSLGNEGTLLLVKGTYNLSNPFSVPSNIKISGNGATLSRIGTGNAINVVGTSTNRVHNIIIEDIIVQGTSTAAASVQGNGIQTDYADNITIRGCTISGFGSLGDDGGIALRRSTNIRAFDSLLIGNLNGAICGASTATYPDVSGMSITNCIASDNWNDGIHAQQSTDIVWQNNKAFRNGESGFDTLGCTSIAIIGNTSNSNTHSGIESGNTTGTGSADSGLVISDNICIGNTLNGIQILGTSDYPNITGNICRNNLVDGIQLAGNSSKEVRRALISDNILLANGRDGIRVTNNNSGHSIRNNHIYDNAGRGILVTAGTGTTINDIYIAQNRFGNNTTAAVDTSGSGTLTNVVQRDNISNTNDTKPTKHVVFYAPGTASAWSSMPAALTEFRGQTATRVKANLSAYTQFRISVRVSGTAGATNSVIGVQYSTDESTWNFLDDGSVTSGTNAASVSSINTTSTTSWTTLASNALGDITLRVVGQNGDGTISPTFGLIALEVK